MVPLIIALMVAAGAPHLPAGGRIVTTSDLHVGVRPHMTAVGDRIDAIGVTVQVTVRGL